MPVTVLHKPRLFDMIRVLPDVVSAGVAVKGKAAKYAQVWEWGTVRLHQPGPKTTWGSNPDDGSTRIFTKTAPSGYVRIHKAQFYDMALTAVKAIDIQVALLNGSFTTQLKSNLNRMATEAAQLMAFDAPIDTGLLRASLTAIQDDEVTELLQAAYRPLIIGELSA